MGTKCLKVSQFTILSAEMEFNMFNSFAATEAVVKDSSNYYCHLSLKQSEITKLCTDLHKLSLHHMQQKVGELHAAAAFPKLAISASLLVSSPSLRKAIYIGIITDVKIFRDLQAEKQGPNRDRTFYEIGTQQGPSAVKIGTRNDDL